MKPSTVTTSPCLFTWSIFQQQKLWLMPKVYVRAESSYNLNERHHLNLHKLEPLSVSRQSLLHTITNKGFFLHYHIHKTALP